MAGNCLIYLETGESNDETNPSKDDLEQNVASLLFEPNLRELGYKEIQPS